LYYGTAIIAFSAKSASACDTEMRPILSDWGSQVPDILRHSGSNPQTLRRIDATAKQEVGGLKFLTDHGAS